MTGGRVRSTARSQRPHAGSYGTSIASGANTSQPVSGVELRIDITRPAEIHDRYYIINNELRSAGIARDQVVSGPNITYEGQGF